MFKNRSLQVQMVKTPKQKDSTDTHECAHMSLEQINVFAKDQVRNLAVVSAGLYAAKKVLDTTCQIAIIKSTVH